jgi:hypothetical protein
MSNELLRPIDPETAKAIEAVANLGGKAIGASEKVGGWLDRVLGRLPDHFLGLVVGDWVYHKRIRRWAELQAETEAILAKRGVAEPEISPSLAMPLILAAVDETRSELKELWARLLANAMDPKRGTVRLSFIEAVKKLDPLDALVLQKLRDGQNWQPTKRDVFAQQLKVTATQIEVSFVNLDEAKCLYRAASNVYSPNLSAFGIELLNALD